MKKSLTGSWRFRATDEEQERQATVPGCQFLDLMRAGVIEDPFVGVNEAKVQWVHDKDYVYAKTFDLTQQECDAAYIDLVCEQLDTIAEVTLNGCKIGRADNCHRAHVFPLKEGVRVGENRLEILFFSPKRYVEAKHKQQPTPINVNGQNGIVHIRKPQCHFGWDWGPVLIPVGISGDIYLDIRTSPRSAIPTVRTERREDGAFEVRVTAVGSARIRLIDPDGNVCEQQGERATFVVTTPQLWWTKELSDRDSQPLYTVQAVTCTDGVEECQSRRIGLRTLTLDRGKDRYGYNFRFVLNGVPLFAKGTNYIPSDSFITRFDEARRTALLDAVQFANMNMLRVWGGGYYADDALLDECDRRGILVWQDCMFACQAYPFFDEEFLANVLGEIEYNVTRMATHPCLALWCGNNEIEDMHMAWMTMTQYVEWTERFFYHILPQHIACFDPDTPYVPGSPSGIAHNKDTGADYVGDTHLWGVWHGLKPMTYYRRRLTRFCSEFGFESLPSFPTLRSFATPAEYALNGAVQRSHQKCAGGNDKMLYYIASRFRLSEDIEDLIYLSQVTQQTCIADATEHWRRHKGQCNGSLYWQLNDCWPTCSWSGYDYLGEYKALQYAARWFNAPLSVSLEDTTGNVRVHLLNDLMTPRQVEVAWCVFDFTTTSPTWTRTQHRVAGGENAVAVDIDTTKVDPRRQGIAVRLYREGQCVMQKTCLLLPEKKLALPKGEIEIRDEVENGVRRLSLRSAVYQRLVMVQVEGAGPLSDNFFDLLPGETKVVTLAVTDAPVRVRSVATLHKAGIFKTLRAKTKVFLSPRNIANAIYHGRVPKPYRDEE